MAEQGGWPDTGARSQGGPAINVSVTPAAMEAQAIKALQRDPRETRDVQAQLAKARRDAAFGLATLKAQLDREYEQAVKSLGAREGDPKAAPGVPFGGPWGLPIANPFPWKV